MTSVLSNGFSVCVYEFLVCLPSSTLSGGDSTFHNTSSKDTDPSASITYNTASSTSIMFTLYASLGGVSKGNATKLKCVWISVGVQIGLVLRTLLPYICYERRPRCKVLWDPAVRNTACKGCASVGTIFGISPIAVTKPCQNTLITPCKPHVSNRITTFTTITTITTMVVGAVSHGDSW